MRRVRLQLLVAGLLALAGCGGGSDPETFATDANAICQKRIDVIDDATRDGVEPSESDDMIVEAYERELGDLRDLGPPSDAEDRFDDMLELYEDGAESYREFAEQREQIEEAAAKGDRETYAELVGTFSDTVRESRRARSRGNKIAEDVGLETCATPLY